MEKARSNDRALLLLGAILPEISESAFPKPLTPCHSEASRLRDHEEPASRLEPADSLPAKAVRNDKNHKLRGDPA